MSEPTKNSLATKLAIRRYLRQIWIERGTALPGLILPGIGTIFGVYAPPLVVAAILTKFGDTKPSLHDIVPYLIAFAGIWFIGELLWRLAFFCLNRADSRVMRNLYIEGMHEISTRDIGFFHDNFAGSLTKRTIGYAKSFESFMDTLSFSVFANLIPILFVGVILWRFSPLLVVVLIGMMALVIAIILPLTKNRKSLVDAREAASNHSAGHIADIIGNMDVVQAFAHEDFELQQHEDNIRDYMRKAQRSWDYHNNRIDMSISPLYVLINVIGLALAITFGKDAASLSAIFVTFNYYAYVTRILFEFNRNYRNIENAIAEAAQFTTLLLEPSALHISEHPKELQITRGEVDFKDVDFCYSESSKALFKHFNLHITAGEKLALVGHSGGGKSTITKLLLRFVDIDKGELLIDGQNIAEGSLQSLRASIAFVPQEPAMFHRSIRENIRYGKLDATDEEVVTAAKQANAHDFIMNLPKGYDTPVGERGVKLSGGQRQRIAIARAVIKDAPILLLDEATSALDSESEQLIQEALWKLMKGRTTIVIAHRLSTIQKMDRIVVLNNGSIAEQGSHAKLLKDHGIYAKLWAHQSGGFMEED